MPLKIDGDIDWLYNRLKITVVDLSDKSSDLKVVRVFSPWLVPINFGFNTTHCMHPVVQYSACATPDKLKMPHYFA